MNIQIQTSECASIRELHALLKEKLNLPGYYGMNLDALWDCLTGWIDLPTTIEWQDYRETEMKLGAPVTEIRRLFEEAEAKIEGFKVNIS